MSNSILRAILDTPHRIYLAFSLWPRIRNILERIAESVVGILVFLAAAHLGAGLYSSIALAVLSEYLFFEWFMEPLKLSGYYWERGPQEGESPDDDGYWQE